MNLIWKTKTKMINKEKTDYIETILDKFINTL